LLNWRAAVGEHEIGFPHMLSKLRSIGMGGL
jgi:hypothetical protein